jgi:D-alanyl-D-alanine carboxypeptidase
MHRMPPLGTASSLRWGCLSLAVAVALVAVASDPVDAKTGAVLHQASPDALRHPASLTKVMTLYLLFERLEAGKISLDTPMEVSAHAASQAPTKLGLQPGGTLKVEDAIKGLVTKSANDAAVVVAETLGGSEEDFAAMMTRKARALGMRNTVYHNASGLPDDAQNTTARDQALLGIAIQNRFPKYYRYFSLPSFVYHGRSLRNHNHLLGSVEGVDGIKTGYTRSSGFNLISSVKRGGRQIVAVVLGGRSAGSRDARMRSLIESNIALASAKPVTQQQVAEAPMPTPRPQLDAAPRMAPTAAPQLAAVASLPMPLRAPQAADNSAASPSATNAPLKPVKVRTVTVKLVPPKGTPDAAETEVAEGDAADQNDTIEQGAASQPDADAVTAETSPPTPAKRPTVIAKLQPAVTAVKNAAKNAVVTSAKADELSIPNHPTVRGGWAIQIGAYENESEAKQHLSSAKSKVANVARKAEAYIERTVKGAKTYYRARFAGFDRDQAHTACKKLKRNDVACMALKI